MTWVAAAVSLGTAAYGASEARKAGSMQADAADRATAIQQAQYETTRRDLQPWVQSGGQANNKLSALMGLNGEDPTAALQSTPGYQFRLNEGMNGVQNSAAARGGLLSGGTLKALQKYGQDFASNEYQNQYNRLSGMSTTGQNAAAGQGAASTAFGTAAANNTMGAGSALASGAMGSANALTQGLGSAINGYQQNQMMDMYSQKNGLGKYAQSTPYDVTFNGTGAWK